MPLPAIALAAFTGCKHEAPAVGLLADSAVVVAAHPLAAQVGTDIMRQGGNAVDAAIATQFVLAVVFPAAGNIGGGGFMIVRLRDGSAASIDYREKAPAAARSTMYLDSTGTATDSLSRDGHLACGVPGTVAGLAEAHRRFGALPWPKVVQPAIDLALGGFPLTASSAEDLNELQAELTTFNTIPPDFLLRDHWNQGDTLKCPELGHTLERIRDQGIEGFYAGKTANDLVAEMRRGNGLITLEDLAAYKAMWREPMTRRYRNYRIILMGPPSSGGIALAQLLVMVEPYEVDMNDIGISQFLIEAERRVFADRSEYLGDPDFYDIPVDSLLDTAYLAGRMANFHPGKATPSGEVHPGNFIANEPTQTTHLSVVDPAGNAVAATTTLNGWFGSKVVVAGSGFFLNNEMDDFSAKSGVPNMYGVTGGNANSIEPGKRMLSSMTPTIVEKDGSLFMVVGSPGGPTIVTSVFQAILRVVDDHHTMQQAVNAPRFHHQWLPDSIIAEPHAFLPGDSVRLTAMGYAFKLRQSMGRVDAILVRPDGTLEGAADPRGDDAAAGF